MARHLLLFLAFAAAAPAAEEVRVTAPQAEVRAEPSPRGALLATLPSGTVLEALTRADGWILVLLPDGLTTGYLRSSLVEWVGEPLPVVPSLGPRPEPPPPRPIAIAHEAARCIVAESFARIEARLAPADEVARASVHFRASGTSTWYHVEMSEAAGVASGVLPKPRRTTKAVQYYVEAVGKSAASRTPEHSAEVVGDPGACPEGAAPFVAAATLTLGAPAGAPPVPEGFLAEGLPPARGTGVRDVPEGLLIGGVAALAGLATAVALGGDEDAAEPLDLTGRWVGIPPDGVLIDRTLDGQPLCQEEDDAFLDLAHAGTSLTGTITLRTRAASGASCPPLGSEVTSPVTGTVDATRVTIRFPLPPSSVTATGTVFGDRMEGQLALSGGVAGTGTWRVVRQ